MLPFQKYKNNNDQKRSTFVEMPSEAQYAIFHEGKSQQCRAETSDIKHRQKRYLCSRESNQKLHVTIDELVDNARARSTFENDRFQVRLYFCECNEFSIFSHQVHIFQIFRSTEHQDFNWQLTYVVCKLTIYSVCLRKTIFDNINKPNKNTAAEENSCLYPGS